MKKFITKIRNRIALVMLNDSLDVLIVSERECARRLGELRKNIMLRRLDIVLVEQRIKGAFCPVPYKVEARK